jgi:membrane-bound lytic murein transglycosylase B
LDAALSPSPGPLALGLAAGLAVLAAAAVSALLAVVSATGPCSDAVAQPAPGRTANTIPANYLALYRRAGARWGVPWTVLAGIGAVESDHGRSRAPGVRSGLNAFGCCAGPMQFNLTDGPPSTWDRYGVDGDRDGHRSPYDPGDAIPSAARYLRALLGSAGGALDRALLGYNRSPEYVADVLTSARTYAGRAHDQLLESGVATSISATCATAGLDALASPVDLRVARRLSAPRAYRPLPHGCSPARAARC